jgi:hypothetical protein
MKLQDQIARIGRMNKSQLLDYVIANPHYLIEPYYRMLAEAIQKRRNDLCAGLPASRRSTSQATDLPRQ